MCTPITGLTAIGTLNYEFEIVDDVAPDDIGTLYLNGRIVSHFAIQPKIAALYYVTSPAVLSQYPIFKFKRVLVEVQIVGVFSEIAPKLLADKRFAQCHRSFVVNMDAISGIQGNVAIMCCGKNVPISKNYSEFKKQYQNRLFSS
jgi:hypothetical protein